MSDSTFKIIHTSDWHLGQHFFGKSRKSEHSQFMSWLINVAVDNEVDAIIVAGDIFDTGAPPSYARELYNQFIVNLHAHHIHLIVLGGNHDSTATLAESKSLLACLNTHVIPGVLADINQHIITLTNPANEPAAIICATPYLRPRDITYSHAGHSGVDKQQTLQQAISDHYHTIYAVAEQRREKAFNTHHKTLPIIATGHLTTVGAKSSESVRDIYIGTLDAFPSSAFPAADYIALGHIHRTQKVGGTEHIRYSGSPIPLSFDELSSNKTILLVEFENGKLKHVTDKDIPRFQEMYLIKGDLMSIETQIQQLAHQHNEQLNHEPCHDENQKKHQPEFTNRIWLHVEVSTQDYLNDLQQRIESMIVDLPFEVLVLRRQRQLCLHSAEADAKETLQELSPGDVFERRLALENWDGEKEQQRKTRITQAFESVLDVVANRSVNSDKGAEE